MSGRQLIRMRGIVKRFYVGQPNELEILHGIDLDVNEGEFVSIVGASGSGKSTLMNMIGVLDRPTEGTYWLDGTDVEDALDDELSQIRNRKIGFVFQNFNLISRTNARVKRLSHIRHSGSVSMFLPSSMGGTNSRPLIQPVTTLTSSVRPCFSARRQSV